MKCSRPKSIKASSTSAPRRRLFEGPEQPFEKGAHSPRTVVLENDAWWRARTQTRERPQADPDEAFLDYPERHA